LIARKYGVQPKQVRTYKKQIVQLRESKSRLKTKRIRGATNKGNFPEVNDELLEIVKRHKEGKQQLRPKYLMKQVNIVTEKLNTKQIKKPEIYVKRFLKRNKLSIRSV
jgi:hypothetical protein